MAKRQGNIVALYERLSRDDEQLGDSISIVNQKKMLETYAKENGYRNYQHYTDDGYSGGSFERPGWKKMIADIEAGKISTVIAKDMSRIGRNYLEVGYYTEIYFGQKDIHFIAISNNVDSDNKTSSEFAPFLNIMNEWYLKDCSNKIKASKRSLGNSGVHLASTPPYGYRKDPNDKHKWLVDAEAAEVVRLIYNLCIEGKGPQRIASILSERGIECPAYYNGKKGIGRYRNVVDSLDPYHWNGASVRLILTRPEYLGHTVNFKTSSKSYKEHKNIINEPDKWVVFEGTQEPIVDLYSYQLVQKLLGTGRRCDTYGEANPLTGLVYCGDCGAKMYNHRTTPYVTRFGQKKKGFDAYDCSSYKLSSTKRVMSCCSHHISSKALHEVILFTIQTICNSAVKDRPAFVQRLQQEMELQNEIAIKDKKKKCTEYKTRFNELGRLFQKLYESYASSIISEDKFKMLSSSYETEQKDLQERINVLEQEMAEQQKGYSDISQFCTLVDRYTSFDFKELTPTMLNEFIDKIFVYKAKHIDGKRTQQVDIYLNFVGKIDFSHITPPCTDSKQEQVQPSQTDSICLLKENRIVKQSSNQQTRGKRLAAAKQADREKIIQDFQTEAATIGIANMSITPARLKNGGAPSLSV